MLIISIARMIKGTIGIPKPRKEDLVIIQNHEEIPASVEDLALDGLYTGSEGGSMLDILN